MQSMSENDFECFASTGVKSPANAMFEHTNTRYPQVHRSSPGARHTFGTVAMAETRNPGLVKEVMGHESLTTTMGYLHPETGQIKAVIDRLNQQKHVT